MAWFHIAYVFDDALVQFVFALAFSFAIAVIFAGFIMLAVYAVYDFWPSMWWPKNRPTVIPGSNTWMALRGTKADVDRIANFMISEQEASGSKSKLTLASRMLWSVMNEHTDNSVKASLARKASTAMLLKSQPVGSQLQLEGLSHTSVTTWEQEVAVGEDAQVMAKSKSKSKKKGKRLSS